MKLLFAVTVTSGTADPSSFINSTFLELKITAAISSIALVASVPSSKRNDL